MFVKELVESLRNYGTIPSNEGEFVQFMHDNHSDLKVNPNQRSAFKVLTQVAIERALLLHDYLPLLLQNAIILNNPQTKSFAVSTKSFLFVSPFLSLFLMKQTEGGKFVYHLVQSCILNRSFNEQLVHKVSTWLNTKHSNLNKNLFSEDLLELVELLSEYSENDQLREKWSETALQWCAGSFDVVTSFHSVLLFKLLNFRWTAALTSNFLWTTYIVLQSPSLHSPVFNTSEQLTSILTDRVKKFSLSSGELENCFKLGCHLLCTSASLQFKSAVSLLREVSSKSPQDFFPHFFSIWEPQQQVIPILVRASLSTDCLPSLLWLLKQISLRIAPSSPSKGFAVQLLLILLAKSCLTSDKEKNETLHFFSDFQGASHLTVYTKIFSRPNFRIKDKPRKNFLTDLFSTFASQFPSADLFYPVVDYFLVALRQGDASDRKVVWMMFEEFLK